MNRKIFFRGYNLKNKKWLYGYYLVNRGLHFIAPDGVQPPGVTWEDFEVDPESVGQYVGEVNGVELYEGDYVYDENSKVDVGFHFYCEVEHLQKKPAVISKRLLYRCEERDILEYELRDMKEKTYSGYVNFDENYKIIGNEYEEKRK